MGIEPSDSGLVTGYQVDEFTHTWLAVYFIGQPHIFSSFMGKVSTPTPPFWTKQSKILRQVLILSSWTLSTPQSWIHPLMRLVECLLQSTQGLYTWLLPFLIILSGSLLLASNFINYGARPGHYFNLYHRQVVCQPLSWFIMFQSSSRLLCHLTTSLWILAIRRLISLFDFQTGIGTVGHATSDTEHLISYIRAACILAIFLILLPCSVMKSRLHNFPVFTGLRILFLLMRFAFMVTTTGPRFRAHQQSSLGLPSLQPQWGVSGPGQRLGSGLMYRIDLCQSLLCPVGDVSTKSTDSKKMGAMEDGFPDVLQSAASPSPIFCAIWWTSCHF